MTDKQSYPTKVFFFTAFPSGKGFEPLPIHPIIISGNDKETVTAELIKKLMLENPNTGVSVNLKSEQTMEQFMKSINCPPSFSFELVESKEDKVEEPNYENLASLLREKGYRVTKIKTK